MSIFTRIDRALRPQGRIFYGWWIVSATGGVHLLSSLLWMQSYGAYLVLLQEDFGWSKTAIAGAFALTRVESGLLGPLQGWMVDRLGPRRVMQMGMILFGIGFMLFSQVESIVTFYLSFALIAVGSSLGGFATVMVAVVSWFRRHRSKAVALSQIGFSIGGLCVPILVIVLEVLGWRTTAFLSGVVVLIVGLPLAQVFRHRPESYGEVPDGIREPAADSAAPDRRMAPQDDMTAREAMRTRAFWLISLGHAVSLLTVSSMMVHLISLLTQSPLAFTLAAAGGVVACMTGSQIAGLLAGGYLGDRFSKRFVCCGCLLAHGMGMLLVAHANVPWVAIGGVVLHGIAWGVRGPLMSAMRADYFGTSSFGTIMGFSALIVMFGMSIGPIFAGYMADMTGSFVPGFTILGVVTMIGAVSFLWATPPVGKATRV